MLRVREPVDAVGHVLRGDGAKEAEDVEGVFVLDAAGDVYPLSDLVELCHEQGGWACDRYVEDSAVSVVEGFDPRPLLVYVVVIE